MSSLPSADLGLGQSSVQCVGADLGFVDPKRGGPWASKSGLFRRRSFGTSNKQLSVKNFTDPRHDMARHVSPLTSGELQIAFEHRLGHAPRRTEEVLVWPVKGGFGAV